MSRVIFYYQSCSLITTENLREYNPEIMSKTGKWMGILLN